MSWLSESDYNFIYSRSPRICVDLVIIGSDGIPFMIKRDIQPYKGKYHLPGGRVRFRESIAKAIQRIAKNEIGCSVSVKKLLGFMEFTRERQSSNKRHSISLCFLVTTSKKFKTPCITERQILSVHYKFLKEHNL